MLTGSELTILDVLFMTALLVCACWKTGWIRIILSICIITWGAYAIPYDMLAGGIMAGIGLTLCIMGIMKQIESAEGNRDD